MFVPCLVKLKVILLLLQTAFTNRGSPFFMNWSDI
jgi:hypothetical protein